MQSFPLFLTLKNRQALVVGGGEEAARKMELLLSSGARVSLIAETVVGEIAHLIAERRVAWSGRSFQAEDLAGVSLVIVADDDDEALQARVSHAAQQRGVPVNVVDCPELSSFIMPAIVDRGPVTVAISTGGAAPALARRLRAEIERALPSAIGRLARFAEIFRAQVRRTLSEPRARRRFWDLVFEGRVGELALAGDEIAARRELIRLLDNARNPSLPAQGMVHVAGAGPGDPDLLTLKTHRLLQRADVVVYDAAVSPAVIAMARRDAERISVDSSRRTQAETNERLVALVRAGMSVVRLRNGDGATIGSQGDEEIAALMAAGIAVELVPGVTEPPACATSDAETLAPTLGG
jgi:uroporphyrin-III C-methyltransferase / precorrin-2 dehydrogenase / sirohydrochlorin ferrochelatase